MEYEWFKEDESHTAAIYASRAVIPYLLIANLRSATTAYHAFTSALDQDKGSAMSAQEVSGSTAEIRVYPSLPLLNFLGLLILACQRASADLYRQLTTKYAAHLKDAEIWHESMELIAEMYFGIARPRQSNPLMDMMSGLFGGGAGGAGAGGARKAAVRPGSSLPAAEGLD